MTTRSYLITPRAPELGGGWNLKFFDGGKEMGGGVFPPVPNTKPEFDEAYGDALEEGETWVTNGQFSE